MYSISQVSPLNFEGMLLSKHVAGGSHGPAVRSSRRGLP
jgi:hypothetical protein